MKLLIFTQEMDKNDAILGFFCGWVTRLSKEYESIHVICLEEGEHSLPENVTVYSLGKEEGVGKMGYVLHACQHLYSVRGEYDRVFVHMNQEYILLFGWYWKMKMIPVYMWRNHPYGNLLTHIAIGLSKKVFCTSTQSFTARFKKTVIMPVGVDTSVYKPNPAIGRKKNSICMIGRIAPIKNIDLALIAVKILIDSGFQTSLTIVGSCLERDREYYNSLKTFVSDNKLASYIIFIDEVAPSKIPDIYNEHRICLNLTQSGSFDKTIVESAACGLIPIVSNDSLRGLLPDSCITTSDPKKIANSIQEVLSTPTLLETQKELEKFSKEQSLGELMRKLVVEMNS
ncbi:MAG: glycosyltransferase family 4 protein [bacterium]